MFTFTYGLNCPHCGADLTEPDSIVAANSASRIPIIGAAVRMDEHGYLYDGYCDKRLHLDDPDTIFSCLGCHNRLDVIPKATDLPALVREVVSRAEAKGHPPRDRAGDPDPTDFDVITPLPASLIRQLRAAVYGRQG